MRGIGSASVIDPARGLDWDSIWSRTVEDKLRAHTYVKKVADGCMTVKVDSSSYLQMLCARRPALLKSMREVSGGRITSLVFTMA